MEQSNYKIDEAESTFSEREILDETCRFGDWQHHVVFELKNTPPTPSSEEASTDSPIATQTRVP
jgi:hypothetical protein